MLRNAVARTLRVTRGLALFGGAVVTLALVVGVASVAFGANGGNFILGQGNTATKLTRLTGNANGCTLQVVNNDVDANDHALNLQVQQGEAPMRVNSEGKVGNLNADKLDNLEPSQIKGAKAYAFMDPDAGTGGTPAFLPGKTSGFTEVERIGTVPSGNYCLKAPGLSPDNRLALVSVDAERTASPEGLASAMTFSGKCTNNRFAVITKRAVLSGGNLADVKADDVAFAIAVL